MTVLWIVLILLSVALALGYVLIQRRRRRLDDHLQALAESVASRGLDLGPEQDYDKVVDELTNRYDKKELRQLYQRICRRWGKAQDATLRLRQQPAHQGYEETKLHADQLRLMLRILAEAITDKPSGTM
ncbi:hypothetical protein AB0X98_06715 [Rothia koreensis]|uniref:hypothetical protein n=1 Tax=Rothia koreensis TaxID=592378 RepID=UPI003F255B7F